MSTIAERAEAYRQQAERERQRRIEEERARRSGNTMGSTLQNMAGTRRLVNEALRRRLGKGQVNTSGRAVGKLNKTTANALKAPANITRFCRALKFGALRQKVEMNMKLAGLDPKLLDTCGKSNATPSSSTSSTPSRKETRNIGVGTNNLSLTNRKMSVSGKANWDLMKDSTGSLYYGKSNGTSTYNAPLGQTVEDSDGHVWTALKTDDGILYFEDTYGPANSPSRWSTNMKPYNYKNNSFSNVGEVSPPSSPSAPLPPRPQNSQQYKNAVATIARLKALKASQGSLSISNERNLVAAQDFVTMLNKPSKPTNSLPPLPPSPPGPPPPPPGPPPPPPPPPPPGPPPSNSSPSSNNKKKAAMAKLEAARKRLSLRPKNMSRLSNNNRKIRGFLNEMEATYAMENNNTRMSKALNRKRLTRNLAIFNAPDSKEKANQMYMLLTQDKNFHRSEELDLLYNRREIGRTYGNIFYDPVQKVWRGHLRVGSEYIQVESPDCGQLQQQLDKLQLILNGIKKICGLPDKNTTLRDHINKCTGLQSRKNQVNANEKAFQTRRTAQLEAFKKERNAREAKRRARYGALPGQEGYTRPETAKSPENILKNAMRQINQSGKNALGRQRAAVNVLRTALPMIRNEQAKKNVTRKVIQYVKSGNTGTRKWYQFFKAKPKAVNVTNEEVTNFMKQAAPAKSGTAKVRPVVYGRNRTTLPNSTFRVPKAPAAPSQKNVNAAKIRYNQYQLKLNRGETLTPAEQKAMNNAGKILNVSNAFDRLNPAA